MPGCPGPRRKAWETQSNGGLGGGRGLEDLSSRRGSQAREPRRGPRARTSRSGRPRESSHQRRQCLVDTAALRSRSGRPGAGANSSSLGCSAAPNSSGRPGGRRCRGDRRPVAPGAPPSIGLERQGNSFIVLQQAKSRFRLTTLSVQSLSWAGPVKMTAGESRSVLRRRKPTFCSAPLERGLVGPPGRWVHRLLPTAAVSTTYVTGLVVTLDRPRDLVWTQGQSEQGQGKLHNRVDFSFSFSSRFRLHFHQTPAVRFAILPKFDEVAEVVG